MDWHYHGWFFSACKKRPEGRPKSGLLERLPAVFYDGLRPFQLQPFWQFTPEFPQNVSQERIRRFCRIPAFGFAAVDAVTIRFLVTACQEHNAPERRYCGVPPIQMRDFASVPRSL